MFHLSVPWWELVLRSVIIYVALLLLLRMTGKRQTGQLAPFDLVLLLLLSNAVQNSMNAGDNSLIGGVISAVTLIALNFAVGGLVFKSKHVENWVEGKPQVLIHDGKLVAEIMRESLLTQHELNSALRREGCCTVGEVSLAILEMNGSISVIKRKDNAQPHFDGEMPKLDEQSQ